MLGIDFSLKKYPCFLGAKMIPIELAKPVAGIFGCRNGTMSSLSYSIKVGLHDGHLDTNDNDGICESA